VHSRRKIPGTILASCLAAGVLVLILFHESSHRPILMGPGAEVPSRTLPESQTPVSGPTGYGGRSTGGAIGLEGVGPFTQDPTYAPGGTAIAFATDRNGGPYVWVSHTRTSPSAAVFRPYHSNVGTGG